ncbi:MAG TPA: DUF4139 domain-containing protein [Brevundimonas sp.]|jgi:hypothetical protein|uniref:DUF4139 domain-containing protein n=1 Tax=Brevundimonas sp. TaxID=1871086 RepID=UPI002DE4DB99|nr:DUF4139 domain-containing protein [Brevundimonas sp.]
MMMRRTLLAGAALALMTGAAAAQEAQIDTRPGGPERVDLTIYQGNVTLVEDIRGLSIPAGRSRQEFPGVSASIRPETVSLTGRGLEVVEQNFDYDLLTPDKLMQSAVGQEIGLVRINPGTGREETQRATVLAANEGVVLRIGGNVEVLRDDGVPTRVIFDEVPANLRPRPTLSVTLDAEGAGRRDVTLTYLTSGLSWTADYVMRVDEQASTLDLLGWVTISNRSGATFTDAETRVVAGDVSSGGNYRGNGIAASDDQSLGDYYVYPLPERVTVANNQNKQVGLLDVSGVATTKRYLWEIYGFTTSAQPQAVEVAYLFANGPINGQNRSLPAGTIRVYINDASGEPRFIGEDSISHTPAGSDLAITTGEAFDVTVQPRLVSEERVSTRIVDYFRTRRSVEYTLRNARPEPVTIEVRQGGLGRDTEIQQQSHPGVLEDSRTVVWKVQVPANGEVKLTATIETGG